MKKKLWLFLLLLHTQVFATEGLVELNNIRQQAGMIRLDGNFALQQAAQNHALYLSRHYELKRFVSAHTEQSHLSGFSGETPAKRAKYAQYQHEVVRENVSVGEMDMHNAIEGLMGAIYHQFTFLDFSIDQAGIASKGEAFVFEMGRSDLVDICRYRPKESQFQSRVQCGDSIVTQAFYQGLCVNLPDDALFKAPWKQLCPNGTALDASYMQAFCQNPPNASVFESRGRYYTLCDKKIRVNAAWFDQLCANPPMAAQHNSGERYYELCDTKVRTQWLEEQCRSSQAPTDSGYFRDLCGTGERVRVDYIEKQTRQQQLKNPDVVYWPSESARDVPPAFFQEDPDPLPDYDVSGYPISIQVNPQLGESVNLRHFRLYKVGSSNQLMEIEHVRLLDQNTDPNNKFSAFQFALMPLDRLDWSSTYQVESLVMVDGRKYEKNWRFSTRSQGARTITLLASHPIIRMNFDEEISLYRPPTSSISYTMKHVSARFPGSMKVKMNTVDFNTLNFKVLGRHCGLVKLTFFDGYEVKIQVDGC